LSSRSSNSDGDNLLPLGRVIGHRGAKGELTVRLAREEGARWTALERVWIGKAGEETVYEIESSRAYRDRLVLKLKGIDGADQAAQLRGMNALVARGEEPELPEDSYYVARLVGMEVRNEAGERLGEVSDVMPTAGADLLLVQRGDDEVMIPLAKEIVIEVSEEQKRITVRLPEGLLEINEN
jgi:16S rRNA processing protein RimM